MFSLPVLENTWTWTKMQCKGYPGVGTTITHTCGFRMRMVPALAGLAAMQVWLCALIRILIPWTLLGCIWYWWDSHNEMHLKIFANKEPCCQLFFFFKRKQQPAAFYLWRWLWMLQKKTSRLKYLLPVSLGQVVPVHSKNILVIPQMAKCPQGQICTGRRKESLPALSLF